MSAIDALAEQRLMLQNSKSRAAVRGCGKPLPRMDGEIVHRRGGGAAS